jgi:transposase
MMAFEIKFEVGIVTFKCDAPTTLINPSRLAHVGLMVYRHISDDLKEAAIRLKNRGRDTDHEIREITGFSTKTLHRAIRRKHATGSVAKAQAIGRGRPRSLLRRDCDYLLQLARYKPTLFLDEYSRRLEQFRQLSVSMTTIHRTLERAGLNVKHVQKMASERDPTLRADFIRRIGEYPAHYLISIDEVSKDDRTYTRLWGRAPVGQRVEQHDPFVRKRRYSMLAGLVLDEGIISSRVLEGSFTHDTFLEYLRDDLVGSFFHLSLLATDIFQLPLTTPFPGPRSVLLLDNARIHHSEEVTNLVQSFGKYYGSNNRKVLT